MTGLPIGYSVIIALTGLPIGYSVIVALTGLPVEVMHKACHYTCAAKVSHFEWPYNVHE